MLTPDILRWKPVDSKHIGVQLYSVRDAITSNPLKTIQAIADIGYKEVEGFGYNEGLFFGLTPKEFGKAISDAGMTMPSIHYMIGIQNWDDSTRQFNDTTKAAIELFAGMGQKMVVCPFVVKAQRDPESARRLSDIFNRAGELCKKHGMSFCYHNHDFEFEGTPGNTMYDIFLSRTDPRLVEIQLDLYWVVYARQNPTELIRKIGDRLTSFHVKDMASNRDTAEVGEGSINFAELFALPEVAKVKYYIVELEHYKTTPVEGIGVSYKNLKKLLNA
jgi:sugar phosphate isomerase/epimerase